MPIYERAGLDRHSVFSRPARAKRFRGRIHHPDRRLYLTHCLRPWFAGLSALGVILAAVYLLHMFGKVFLGTGHPAENKTLSDLNGREIVTLLPILILIFWIGLYPQPFFAPTAPAVDKLVAILQAASAAGLP